MRTGLSVLSRNDGLAAATQAAELLGNLRGIAAKLGQMASYVEGFVPEPQREAYERILSTLQAATPASPFPQIRAIIESELEQPLSEAFAEFEPAPLASASIGQVHRAKLHDGRAVAVKVQHAGIEAAVETDLTSAGAAASLFAVLGPKGFNTSAVFEEVADAFRRELDYRFEAEQQRLFASLHADDPRVHVPTVIDSHSTRRVLCSELVTGSPFADAVQAPEPLRRSYAELLWQFVFKSLLVHGRFNADPHPGNFIFHPDGRITFLDFGCIQVMPPRQHDLARAMHTSALAGHEAAFKRAAAELSETARGPYEDDLLAYLWRCYEPVRQTPYRVTQTYVASVVRGVQEFKRHMLKKSSNITPVPSGLVLTNRLQFGFYSVLSRLDVEADYAGVERAFLEAL
jgi:predicted unusual protein kinase regulating ubiquinone biosynthesis (AarF/ABC1/UbiB family)